MVRRVIWVVALVLLLNATVAAQEIELLVDKLEITLYDTLRLVVRVPGSNTQPKLSLPEWTVSYLGSAYRMTSINGVVEQYTEYTYQLAPKETGVFTIGPIEVVQNGRTLKSGTVVIKVVEGTVQPHPDIFLTLELPKERVYVYEQVPLTLHLYTRLQTENLQWPQIEGEGFVLGQFQDPTVRTETINGRTFQVVSFETTVTFIKSGKQSLGPARIRCEILEETPSRSLFPGFFPTYERRSFVAVSEALTIDVLPVPSPAPAGFTGAIGQFTELHVEVDPRSGVVGDPLTVTFQLVGTGTAQPSDLPAFQSSDDLQVHPVNLREKDDTSWVYEQVVIPKAPLQEIPSLTFWYFDPQRGEYRSLSTAPVPLQLVGEPILSRNTRTAAPGPAVPLGEDIMHIKVSLGELPGSGTGLWVVAASWTLVVGGISLGRHLRQRPRQPKVKPGPDALQQLSALEQQADPGEILPVLQSYLQAKFGLSTPSLTADQIPALFGAQLEPELVARLQELWGTLEQIRYAREKSRDQQLFLMAKELVRELERVG